MNTIKGKLDPFFETGTEGVIWSLFDDTKEGYDALVILDQGDYLTIFDPDDSTKVVWEGNIDLEYERNYHPYPMNPQSGQQAIMGMWVHGIQRNVEPDEWGTWFFKAYPAELIKSEIGRLYRCKSSTVAGYGWNGKGSSYNEEGRSPGDLIVKFKNGGCYRYRDVDFDTWWGLVDAESKGKYIAKSVKNKFITEKIELPKPEGRYPDDPVSNDGAYPFPTYNKP